jgi:hypothetical protein
MTAAALILGALAVMLVAVALVALQALRRAVADLQTSIDDLAAGAATIDDLKRAVSSEPDPVDEPEPVVSRVPTVLRTRSVVKAMALGTGTAHAARRLRNGRS